MYKPIPCYLYRGGTSKGLFFRGADLPDGVTARDRLLLAAMGSPDPRQIDGLGGAHPLTSKVAIVSHASRADADLDYLFLQVAVDKAEVSGSQNCGNMLAAVGPFAIESGLITPAGDVTHVRIHMVNTGARAVARVQTPGGRVSYEGNARIDGVPGTSAPILIEFHDIAGSSCGALLPTGNVIDSVEGVSVTCIDNGMPVVLLDAGDFGLRGDEQPLALESNPQLTARIETIRRAVGERMRLGDVASKTVPKMCLVSPPQASGVINTRTFIPHRVHEAIGVLGSVSVATACVLAGSVAQRVSGLQATDGVQCIEVEHPSGFFTIEMDVSGVNSPATFAVNRAALLRTARLLMQGSVFVPEEVQAS